ncbi:DUF1266 domain-containing protein [Bartonella sp. HY329]|uniref:DUF1266 domain-containing protein n=1 Tax=unclassified Bartonella TaxID=2645622 RepID=UPI0021C6CF13|nr:MULTISPECIES: DUF1266 domain-containing protein [unclassified Bartonella]UXM94685.1 DUF1266 domain-containing protein [Bartonella sp. HY329]UXN09008.1 DUF1266 domain-containing protein [Bartonella sp. HY328]
MTKEEITALALDAPYSEGSLNQYQQLASNEGKRRLRSGMKAGWGIVDSDSFNEIVDWLLNEGHRYYFDMVAPRANAMCMQPSIDKMNEDVEYFSTFEEEGLENYYEKLIMMLDSDFIRQLQLAPVQSVLAWDMARLVGVTRNAVVLNYVNEENAWSICNAALIAARSQYANWGEFADAFLFGRAFWYDFDDETMPASFGEMEEYIKTCDKMLNDPHSIWSLYPLHEK